MGKQSNLDTLMYELASICLHLIPEYIAYLALVNRKLNGILQPKINAGDPSASSNDNDKSESSDSNIGNAIWKSKYARHFHWRLTKSPKYKNANWYYEFKRTRKHKYLTLTKNQKILCSLLKEGDIEEAKQFMPEVKLDDAMYKRLTNLALKNKDQTLLDYFYQHAVENRVEYKNNLHWACRCNQVPDTINALLERIYSANADDSAGNTPLCIAATLGHHTVVITLLQNDKIDINATMQWKRTALYCAVEQGHLDVVNTLLKDDRIDHKGTLSLLEHATSRGFIEIVTALIENRKSTFTFNNIEKILRNIYTGNGFRYVKRAILDYFYQCAVENNPDPIDILYWACLCNQSANTIELLIAQGSDINAIHDNHITPLYTAATMGHDNVVETLLQYPEIDINISDHGAGTPFYIALCEGHPIVVYTFVNHNLIDANRISQYNDEIPLRVAINHNRFAVFKVLLNHNKIDVNQTDEFGKTPLHTAASSEHIGFIKLLLEHSDIEIDKPDFNGKTPLYVAIVNGYLENVKILLKYGADISKVTIEGHGEIAKFLKTYCSSNNLKNTEAESTQLSLGMKNGIGLS